MCRNEILECHHLGMFTRTPEPNGLESVAGSEPLCKDCEFLGGPLAHGMPMSRRANDETAFGESMFEHEGIHPSASSGIAR